MPINILGRAVDARENNAHYYENELTDDAVDDDRHHHHVISLLASAKERHQHMQMVTYEITAKVDNELSAAFERYMIERHIPDLMATGEFVSANLGRSTDGRFRIRYEARDRAALDRYFKQNAPRLRAEVVDKFPTGVELSREEWDIISTFAADQRLIP